MATMRVTLRSVAGQRTIAEVEGATVGDLLNAARDQGYSSCKLVYKGQRLPLDPHTTLCDAGIPDEAVVTVVGVRNRVVAPAPRPAPVPEKTHRPLSMWGPGGPPSLGALRGAGPAAPPGSIEVGGKTVAAARVGSCDEKDRRAIRQGFRMELIEVMRRFIPALPEDAAREALRLAGGDPMQALGAIQAGHLAPPKAVVPMLARDLRESQLLASRALLRRDPGGLAVLMAELESSHPQLYEAALETQASSEQFVAALSSDSPLSQSAPVIVTPDGQHVTVDAAPHELRAEIEAMYRAFAAREKAKRLEDDQDDPTEPETPQ
eukprot:Hpha_TRINITY_DN15507_c4_g2::TRINITY_DN15507_c4_g2_i1::g.104894::m.104894